MNFLLRLFLTFNATSLIVVVYLVKEQYVICKLSSLPNFISYAIYFALPLIFTFLSIFIANFLDNDSIEMLDNKQPVIKEVEQANNAFLPSYLGYFFVALSVPHFETLIFIFVILFVFTFLSQTLYFNPLYLFFGYHFYYLTTDTNIKIFLITRRTLKDPSTISFPKLKRINDFTFIEKEV
ncbi:hypothetical protein EHS13_23105 [Paenibacillus psychroresistens]|uniref:Uncharacterized protein n=1 Tax=Paenibacillus psychroresistens TaxID=1778678 RepID=A0A6B8RMP8_9BACL|nr:hypothetical protein [Paenibacillus psychroresistens]QGQ97570.1 hypothetical protein EHS13_23105 [Paenibacillus psychroresistens]